MRPPPKFPAGQVRSWNGPAVLMEHYWYPPGDPDEMSMHTHAEYQICVSVDTPGEYFYRGSRHAVPARSVSILHPHEAHAARDVAPRTHPAEFWMFYVSPEFVREVAGTSSPPFVRRIVSTSTGLLSQFSGLPGRFLQSDTRLEQEAALHGAVRNLLAAAGVGTADRIVHAATTRLEWARRTLEDRSADNLSLTSLAREAGMSPGRFCREFHRRFGCPPHRYLVQRRIERAKRLLADGVSISVVAAMCGFADQSHLNRHFRSLTGVTPGRYHDFGRNVQDA